MRRSELSYLGVALVIAVSACALLYLMIVWAYNRMPGQTQERGTRHAVTWIGDNKISVSRLSCGPDSDHDGYASCTVVSPDGSKIFLQCISSWFDELTGAKGCKEMDSLIKINTPTGKQRDDRPTVPPMNSK